MGSGRLEDLRPLRRQRGAVRAALLRGLEIGERIGEAVEGRSCPGPGQQGRAVVRRVANELPGQLSGVFVVGDAAKDMAAQDEQVDEDQRLPRSHPGRRRHCYRARDPRRQPVDLRVQVHHGDGAAGGGWFPVADSGAGHDAGCSADTSGSANGGVRCGGFGFGLAR
jgi:hypothetical protein